MSVITFSYPYGDGRFEPEGHNSNIDNLQKGVNTGALDVTNMAADFKIEGGMIMREQSVFSRFGNCLDTSTYYGEGMGTESSVGRTRGKAQDTSLEDAENPESYSAMAGAGIRWYQPYAASVAIIQWSFFTSHNRWAITDDHSNRTDNSDVTSLTAISAVTAAIDTPVGSILLGESTRLMARNMHYPAGKKVASSLHVSQSKTHKRYVNQEAHSALHYDQHVMIGSGKSDADTKIKYLKKGWYELRILAFMEQPTQYFKTHRNVHLRFANHFRKHSLIFNDKLSVGIRNARVVTFL